MSLHLNYCSFIRRLPFLALIAIAINLISACGKKPEQGDSNAGVTVSGQRVVFAGRPQGIKTKVVEKSTAAMLPLPGRLVWNEDRTVRVFTPFAGRVVRALVQPGDIVKAGQPLAELASPDFGQAQADARKAATDLLLTRQSLTRIAELNAAGIVADKDVQQAQADFRRAEGENTRAQLRLRQVGANNGENFILKAPIAGVVADKSINPGQELRPDQPGPPLFLITDPSQLWVWMDAAELDISQLSRTKPGTTLVIDSTAYPNRSFSGKVVKSADFIDPVSRTFKLRGTVDNPQRELKAEMFVTVSLPISAPMANASQQTIPSLAVMLAGEKRFVLVQEDEKTFNRVEVQVVREENGHTIVTGLGEGKSVVVEGNLYIQQLIVANQPVQSEPARTQTENKNNAVTIREASSVMGSSVP